MTKTLKLKYFQEKVHLEESLTLCNNLPIAHISSGLPLKEGGKKVIKQLEGFNETNKHLKNYD